MILIEFLECTNILDALLLHFSNIGVLSVAENVYMKVQLAQHVIKNVTFLINQCTAVDQKLVHVVGRIHAFILDQLIASSGLFTPQLMGENRLATEYDVHYPLEVTFADLEIANRKFVVIVLTKKSVDLVLDPLVDLFFLLFDRQAGI